MQWSEQIPTEPGWYWMRHPEFPDSEEVIHLERYPPPDENDLYYTSYDGEHLHIEIDSGFKFAGPIPKPTEPTPSTRGSAAIVQVEIGGES